MAIVISRAMECLEEGKLARLHEVVIAPYEVGTSEHFWWARGWLRTHDNAPDSIEETARGPG